MSAEHKSIVRCAIYTRKSSEEGLEQSFNSLDAQREACCCFLISPTVVLFNLLGELPLNGIPNRAHSFPARSG